MSKLYFRYGAMGASKTANALMVAHNYYEKNMKCIVFKPSIDTRSHKDMIESRIGLKQPCVTLYTEDGVLQTLINHTIGNPLNLDCIIVDEAQFLTREQVVELSEMVDNYGIPVICYGLRADFKGELFPGSQALLEFADTIEEIKTVCWCGRKAIMNARIVDGKVVYTGDQVYIGGNESYVSLCRKHWREGRLK